MVDDTPETTLADPGAVSASAADESAPVAVEAAPTVDPDLETAEAMFADNVGLAAVRTSSGWLTRDGLLTPVLSGA